MSTMTIDRGRIIVGVDASSHAAAAAAWAAREAVDRSMPLHLVNALDLPASGPGLLMPESFVEAGYAASGLLLNHLAAVSAGQHPGLHVTTETSEFGAPETLVAIGGDGDLIVTGTRGHGGFAGLLLGSVSLKTAVHAHCSTIVVRGPEDRAPRPELVLGVDMDQDEAPIHFAFESCERLGARLLVVRAWLPAPSYAGYRLTGAPSSDAEQLADIDTLIERVRSAYPKVEVHTRAVRGNAVPSLIEAARGARLLVVGTHHRRAPFSVGAGYVVQGLLSHSVTPVAVVPIV
jgi:nucleotide-binding universal stress UspA family protein